MSFAVFLGFLEDKKLENRDFYNSIILSQKIYNEAELNPGFEIQHLKAVFPQRLYVMKIIFRNFFLLTQCLIRKF